MSGAYERNWFQPTRAMSTPCCWKMILLRPQPRFGLERPVFGTACHSLAEETKMQLSFRSMRAKVSLQEGSHGSKAASILVLLVASLATTVHAATSAEQARLQAQAQAQARQEQQRAQAYAAQERRRLQNEALQERRKEMLEEQQEQRRLKLEAQQEQQRQREEAKRENERLAQEARQQNANRLPSLASATRAMGQGGCDSGNTGDGFGGYAEKLAAKLKPLIGRPTTAGNMLAVLEVQAKPDGAISVIQLRVASGVKEWDEAAMRGLRKLGSLPRHVDGRLPASLVVGISPSWFFVDGIRAQ